MDIKKVLLVRNTRGFGGGEIYQLGLAKMLKENGFESVIVANSKKLISRAKKAGYEVLVPPYIENQNWSGARNLLLPVYFLKLRSLKKWYERIFEEYKPEVVNVQSRDDLIAATTAAKKSGVRVLWTDHADFKNWVLWNVNTRFKNVIGKMIIDLSSEAEAVIFVGQEIFNEAKEMIWPKRLQNTMVIQNGVVDELEKYKKIKVEEQRFIYVGRVVEEKGIKELLGAFRIVRKKYPKATLYIYGAGEVPRYEKMAGEGVKFCGSIENTLPALAEAEVFVLPSYKEGLSLSLLDAAMMGKTIIASSVDGNAEVVEEGRSGLLVPVKDVEKLAEAMEQVLLKPKMAEKLADGARKKYEEEFKLEKIFAKKMLPLYNSKKEKE